MNKKEATGTKSTTEPESKIDPDPTLRDFILETLDSDKAEDIVSIDLAGKTSIADYMIISTGTSSRHIASLADHLKEKLKAKFEIQARIEGADSGEWVIVDAGDVIVHLFRQEVREFYNLEKLWSSDFDAVDYTHYK